MQTDGLVDGHGRANRGFMITLQKFLRRFVAPVETRAAVNMV
jgi:hypothetical protein